MSSDSDEFVRLRLLSGLKKYSQIMKQIQVRGLNERDTSEIVRMILGELFGYDAFFDVTSDVTVRGSGADYAIVCEGRVKILLVVKPFTVEPDASHLQRMSGTSTPHFVEWGVVTNANTWACYRLGVGPDRHPEDVFRATILDDTPCEDSLKLFYLLTKEGLLDNSLLAYWEEVCVLHPSRIVQMLLAEESIGLLRREILRATSYKVDSSTLRKLLREKILRPETLRGITD